MLLPLFLASSEERSSLIVLIDHFLRSSDVILIALFGAPPLA
jgi:hypothetical protein